MAGFDPERDFPAYFGARGISPTCESCGHNEWSSVDGAAALPSQRQIPFIDYKLAVYVLGCRHCGFVRLYLKGVVDEWHKTNIAG